MDKSFQQNESTFFLGFLAGVKIGFDKGYVRGVDDVISYIRTEASAKLRDEHNGNPMAFYRQIKTQYDNSTK